MTTTKIAEFSPVTESDVDPYGECFWTEEMSKNLSQQWTEFVEKVFYEYGEKSAIFVAVIFFLLWVFVCCVGYLCYNG